MAVQTISGNNTGTGVFKSNKGGVVETIVSGVGTFGGGTVAVQRTDEEGTYYNVPGGAFTEDFAHKFFDNIKTTYRTVMAGSTTPSVTIRIT